MKGAPRDEFNEPVVSALATIRKAEDNSRINLRTGPPRSNARGQMVVPGLAPGIYNVQIQRATYHASNAVAKLASIA